MDCIYGKNFIKLKLKNLLKPEMKKLVVILFFENSTDSLQISSERGFNLLTLDRNCTTAYTERKIENQY